VTEWPSGTAGIPVSATSMIDAALKRGRFHPVTARNKE